MGKYISLLRGINISGQKLIKMKNLIELYESLGFQNVITYLQSGNVLFNTKITEINKITGIIEKGIKKNLGYDVNVLIKTKSDFLEILKNNPFLKNKNPDIKKFYVTLLFNTPDAALLDDVNKIKDEYDEFKIYGNVIYINCPDGYGRTKMTNNFFEKKLKLTATTRNWNTINNLTQLADE